MSSQKLSRWLERMPIVSILRGVNPDEVVDIGHAILSAGIGIIEVPLNSPDPVSSIAKLVDALGNECVVGAGTVLTTNEVKRIADAGGEIVVSPNTDDDVIGQSLSLGITPMPGFGSVTEAFTAYQAGARHLKLFPASTYGSGHVAAATAVLPADVQILAVGGVHAGDMQQWLGAGVHGFGVGSDIYKPGYSSQQVHERAVDLVAAINHARNRS